MIKVLFWYGLIAVGLQMITFSYMVWGLLGVVIAVATFPIAALVTSIGALTVFGSWWGLLNYAILFLSFIYKNSDES
jgi:hypothetical protein